MARHLLYFVLPRKDSHGVWRWNLEALRRYAGLFDGRRVLCAAHDGPKNPWPLDGVLAVGEAFPEADTLVSVENDPGLYEGAGWRRMWAELVPSLAPGDYVFWAHAKGVTRPPEQHQACGYWTEAMLEVCLSDWPRTEAAMAGHDLAGCFKLRGRYNRSIADWHYSGGFYWIAARALLAGVPEPEPIPHGAESWPGRHFAEHSGACLFFDLDEHGTRPEQMYDRAYHERVIRPALNRWRREGTPTPWLCPGCLTYPCSCRPRGDVA